MSSFARSTPGAMLLSLLVGGLAALATLVLLVSLARAQTPGVVPLPPQEAADAGTFPLAAPAVPEPAVAAVGPAEAAAVAPAPADEIALVEEALRGVRRADLGWQSKVGLVLVALMALLRRYATRLPGRVGAFFATSEGGSVLLFTVTSVGALGSALSCGGSFDWRLVESVVKLGLVTSGGWHVLIRPLWERIGAPVAEKHARRRAAARAHRAVNPS